MDEQMKSVMTKIDGFMSNRGIVEGDKLMLISMMHTAYDNAALQGLEFKQYLDSLEGIDEPEEDEFAEFDIPGDEEYEDEPEEEPEEDERPRPIRKKPITPIDDDLDLGIDSIDDVSESDDDEDFLPYNPKPIQHQDPMLRQQAVVPGKRPIPPTDDRRTGPKPTIAPPAPQGMAPRAPRGPPVIMKPTIGLKPKPTGPTQEDIDNGEF